LNPRYQTPEPISAVEELIPLSTTEQVVNDSTPAAFGTPCPADNESLHQAAKRLRTAAISAGEAKNTANRYETRSKRARSTSHTSSVVTKEDYDKQISRVIIDWACDHIPDELWEPVTSADGTETFAVSSSGATSVSHLYSSEPRHHAEAMGRSSERDDWKASEVRELDALNELKFADIVDIPPDRILLPVIWVYKYKTDEFGNRVLFKSRLVVRGDMAVAGLDFFETYSPVAKIDSIRLVLALIISHMLIPIQFDISNAYVQSELQEEVYLRAIPGVPLQPGKCYRLLRSLYGLPQSGRNWNSVITAFFIELGFVQLREDLCVFVLFHDGKLVAVTALYVDDILLGVDTRARADWFSSAINA
jgi:hypothetical protein